ncbi:MAG: hypothetical protein OIF32_09745 [Campylobacterales bacterium]|nr:hypothetical protein [Campylobacterales bacterium]
MYLDLVKIGTSKGIRIPSVILKEFNNPDKFKVNVTDYGIFLKPEHNEVRSNWKEKFIKSKSCQLDPDALEEAS